MLFRVKEDYLDFVMQRDAMLKNMRFGYQKMETTGVFSNLFKYILKIKLPCIKLIAYTESKKMDIIRIYSNILKHIINIIPHYIKCIAYTESKISQKHTLGRRTQPYVSV